MTGFSQETIEVLNSEINSHKERINELKFLCNKANVSVYKVLKEFNHLDLNQIEIASRSGVKQPNVAVLLRNLAKIGLISTYRVGGNNKSNFYKLDEDKLDDLYNKTMNNV